MQLTLEISPAGAQPARTEITGFWRETPLSAAAVLELAYLAARRIDGAFTLDVDASSAAGPILIVVTNGGSCRIGPLPGVALDAVREAQRRNALGEA